jgi:hypothetical protein
MDPALATRALLLRARVEGWDEPVYVHPDHARCWRAAAGALSPTLTTILSPFDPDRLGPPPRAGAVRLRLPARVLHAGREAPLRLFHAADPAARRAGRPGRRQGAPRDGIFRTEVAGELEPGVRVSDRFARDIAGALQRWPTGTSARK